MAIFACNAGSSPDARTTNSPLGSCPSDDGGRSDAGGGTLDASASNCTPLVTIQAVNMTTHEMGDSDCNGSCWNIWANGYIANSVSFPQSGTYSFDITAYAWLGLGFGANMELRIDQKAVASVGVNAATMTDYVLSADVPSGSHEVAIALTNDYYDAAARASNYLYIGSLSVSPGQCSGAMADASSGSNDDSANDAGSANGCPQVAGYAPAGYVMVFDDEFDESAFPIANWWTRNIYNDGMSDHAADQQQVFRENNNHIMTGCTMKLTAYAEPDDAGGTQYPSGMLRSKTTFMYGYFEARVKVPGGKGVHPAFWMNSSSFPTRLPENPPEIDTQEFVNNAGTNTVNMMHMDVIDDGPQTHTLLFNDPSYDPVWGNYTANYNFPDDFHIFALLWDTDDTASLYLDGQLIVKRTSKWLYDDGTPAPFANVMVDFEIGGAWPGANGIDNGAFPQAYEIDYVRVYQKPNSVEQTGVDTVGHDLCPPNGGC